jgi:hypothetical protein
MLTLKKMKAQRENIAALAQPVLITGDEASPINRQHHSSVWYMLGKMSEKAVTAWQEKTGSKAGVEHYRFDAHGNLVLELDVDGYVETQWLPFSELPEEIRVVVKDYLGYVAAHNTYYAEGFRVENLWLEAAADPNTPTDVINELAQCGLVKVREAVLGNANASLVPSLDTQAGLPKMTFGDDDRTFQINFILAYGREREDKKEWDLVTCQKKTVTKWVGPFSDRHDVEF